MHAILTNKNSIFENFDILYHLNKKNTIHFCTKLLTKPTNEENKQSDQITASMREIVKRGEQDPGVFIILLGLKELYEKDKGTFIIS